jgi:hypothetical protein
MREAGDCASRTESIVAHGRFFNLRSIRAILQFGDWMQRETLPQRPLYLFYGTQTELILRARDAAVDRILPAEARNENLTEFYPTTTNKISLAELLDEIAGDLATLSFIPDAPKCVVVTNPAELFGAARGGGARAKGKKKEARSDAPLLAWLERVLPQTGHAIILLAFEDESVQLEVNVKSPLYQLIVKPQLGYVRKFAPSEKAFFRIESAIVRRDLNACLRATRELWGMDKGQTPVYNSVTRCLRFLMQANIARERGTDRDPALQAVYFPASAQFSLPKSPPNVQRKYTGDPIYHTRDLIEAYAGVLDVYRAMRPRPDDLYVPDALGLLEQTLIHLMNSPEPPRER